MGIKNNHFCYVCSACNRVNCAIDKDDQWSYYLRINLLGQAEIIGGTIPNMIAFGIFGYLNFYFAKTGKNGLNARMEQKKSREKSLDLYEDWFV